MRQIVCDTCGGIIKEESGIAKTEFVDGKYIELCAECFCGLIAKCEATAKEYIDVTLPLPELKDTQAGKSWEIHRPISTTDEMAKTGIRLEEILEDHPELEPWWEMLREDLRRIGQEVRLKTDNRSLFYTPYFFRKGKPE